MSRQLMPNIQILTLIFTYSSPHSGKGQRVIFASISSGRGDVHVHLFPAPAFSFRNLSMRFKRSWMAPLGEHPLKSEISQDLIRFDIFLVETKQTTNVEILLLCSVLDLISHNGYLFQWKHHVLLDIKNNRFNQRKFNQLAAFWRILEWRSNTSTLSPGGAP